VPIKNSVVVVGAGFFGLTAALNLARDGHKVEIHERNSNAMQGSSLFNQARVHGGYHYPRSLSTAARCRANYERFKGEYQEAILSSFESIYAIAADSKVNSQKFSRLMKMIGAPIEILARSQLEQFDRSLVSAAFNVAEVAFDSSILLRMLLERLSSLDVEIKFGSEVTEIKNGVIGVNSGVQLTTASGEKNTFDYAIVATYGLDTIDRGQIFNENFSYEVCELARIVPPHALRSTAVTIVDGPFWSLTPWPVFKGHVLTHVKYTPHARFKNYLGAKNFLSSYKTSRAEMMIRDSSRYMPGMAECKILGSEYTIKTILKKKDHDDARPIFVRRDGQILSILGSKIDSIYDVEDTVRNFIKADL
jgi:hypothetical protein